PWTAEDDHRIVGWSVPAVADLLIDRGVPLDDATIIESLHDGVARAMAAGVPWRTGAVELLTAARDAGMPCALVTMSYRHLAEVVVRAAPAGAFTTVVAGDDVAHPKPAPDAYLLAAWALDVPAADCVALEDSPTGVASALAAGALTVAVDPDQHVGEHPRLTRSTLADVGVALGLIR
ncbi:MAG: HAD family hydrolase, partial [Cellulomonadaceae bacterium]|nr:HAD family hydrolase [Cellulomonadaceae bacterium]